MTRTRHKPAPPIGTGRFPLAPRHLREFGAVQGAAGFRWEACQARLSRSRATRLRGAVGLETAAMFIWHEHGQACLYDGFAERRQP